MKCCSQEEFYCTNDYNGFFILDPSKTKARGLFFYDKEVNGVENANGIMFSAGTEAIYAGVVVDDDYKVLFEMDTEEWFIDVDVSECNIALVKALPIGINKVYVAVIAYSGYDLYFYSKIIDNFTIFNDSELKLDYQNDIAPQSVFLAYSDEDNKIKDVSSTTNHDFDTDKARDIIYTKIKDDLNTLFEGLELPSFLEIKAAFHTDKEGSLNCVLFILDTDAITVKKRRITKDFDIDIGGDIEAVAELKYPLSIPKKYAFTNFGSMCLKKSKCSKSKLSLIINENTDSFLYFFTVDTVTFFGYTSEPEQVSTLVFSTRTMESMLFKSTKDKVDEFVIGKISINPPNGVYGHSNDKVITMPKGTLKNQNEDINFISCFDIFFNYKKEE